MRTERRHHPSPIGNRLPARRERDPLREPEFLRTLAREVARSERTGEVLSMMILHMREARQPDMHRLLDFLKGRLRLTDEIGWLDEQRFGVLLPATNSAEASIVVESIVQRGLAEAEPHIPWQLMSSDRDADLWTSSESQNGHDVAGGGPPERNGHDPVLPSAASSAPPRAEPLAALLMVPVPLSKRILDVAGASLLLLVLSPFLLLFALAIKLDSRGPVIFRQPRIGHGGRAFTLLKFRTMVENAEQLRDELAKDNHRDGPAFKLRQDPRITRIGRILRAAALDELPQLWNVLVGDMSLVGPRPALPREVVHYEDWQKSRLRMRGGLTCIWQVEGRTENVSFADWMRQDIRYGTRFSARQDLSLIVRTAWVVLRGRADG